MLWSRWGAQSRCSVVGVGVGQACGSQCITGLHPSSPHLHIWVEAFLATLPVALRAEGQLVGACLHLAWWQEPRATTIQVGLCDWGEAGRCRAIRACISWVRVPSGLGWIWVSRAWMSLQQGSVQDQGYIASLSLGSHREEKVIVLRESHRRKGREPAHPLSPDTKTLQIFSMHKCAHLQIKKNCFFTSYNMFMNAKLLQSCRPLCDPYRL